MAILVGGFLVVGVVGFLAWRPASLRAAYRGDVTQELGRTPSVATVTEADLTPLPAPVQRYLRTSGVVGQPRVANVRVRMHGRIRGGPNARWMPLRADQYDFIDTRKRFFYLTSSMFGVPVRGYHRYADGSASMDIRAAAVIPVVRLDGEEMLQSETVTLLNDMCLFAPAALLDPGLVWEEADTRSARVCFSNAGRTVRAELTLATYLFRPEGSAPRSGTAGAPAPTPPLATGRQAPGATR